MSTNYTGNPSAVESPAIIPGVDNLPIIVLPADGDAASAASVAQAFKSLADYIALQRMLRYRQEWPVGIATTTWSAAAFGAYAEFLADTSGTGNTIGASIGDSNIPGGHVNFISAASGYQELFSYMTTMSNTSLRYIQEFDFYMSNVGVNHQTWYLGYAYLMSNAVPTTGAFFKLASGDTYWSCVSVYSGTTTTVTATSPVTALRRFRIEHYGSATAVGGPTVKFYIDGVLVATHTTHIPIGDYGPAFGVVNTTGVSNTAYLGSLMAGWTTQ